MPPLQRIMVLYLVGIFPGDRLMSSFHLQRRDLSSVTELQLNMAPNSFDDQYKGCEDAMAAELEELNRTEFANNSVYAEAWQKAERKISLSPPAGLKREYAIAIAAYTIEGPLYRDFNAAVREAGQNTDYYLNDFHFKTFHFLLTRAIQDLGAKAAPKCYKVHRGVKKIRFVPGGNKMIRFGHFTSSSLKREVALQFGEDTFFNITTCRGVSIKDFSFSPEQDEVLIPPYEKFEVAGPQKPGTTTIDLLTLGESSTYNCAFVKGGSGSHLSTNLEAPFLLWGFLLFAGGLGAPGLL
ncbi:GPI-linked NAD(P)(+)--arginine ADP-ribosyltransferase 1-like isoform X2 [Sphaerodactylus townsendi]|uniref:GPI-linked NAD(P)(+)--arginine ADP-ribosyltransferase 1-like isoform X2 n=1 Tax=Sphaerodactylus townsendi TaxID=933632 RepID=UPI0020268779|nr:GPI-linked NAD(P)(+)--arginine ADP-ribosyltransferase 1-like isoform X2 [Sphaerodactylus townsendi]